jgi:SAM-dependent MidA family methyltransferase
MKPSTVPCDPAILGALRARAGGRPALSFSEFMEVALYEPELGYYCRRGPRIGYRAGTDFLTASASAPLFGRLVAAACVRLLGEKSPSGFEFVEIGAEPGGGILRSLGHPFRSSRQIGIGEPLRIEGPSVVFSNELFDAQPFRRFRFRSGQWRELGVAVEGVLAEVELADAELPQLPAGAAEGYVIDAPLAAAALAGAIAEQPWPGLFLAFDYGKSWEELSLATPAGTARTYFRHAQGIDLLMRPGEQDLTCHVCWDWITAALQGGGFDSLRLESQEGFFIRHSGELIAALAAAEAGRLSREKLSLLQLLHPAHLGQKFQALWAIRQNPAPSRSA